MCIDGEHMAPKAYIPNLKHSSKVTVFIAPPARFAQEFATIVQGTSGTVFAERAILAAANEIEHRGRTWRDYWDKADGSPEVALFLLYADTTLTLDSPQQLICDFIHAHERFFFEREGKALHHRRRYIEALWPSIENFRLPEHWSNSKAIDAWKTGDMMVDMLKKAKLKPPTWGPGHE